ncbi:hypothetical protein MNBD_GAMMA26-84 [hydrothermal vent metagenome]|uniref:Uncharacterized protein n=1 Tax=hydrothermal vent metagenome TaxID=652676 RepID=A0A3B1BI45_9ZZZZ
MKAIHPMALFRSNVLGPLISRDRLQRGELTSTIKKLASHSYDIPGSRNTTIWARRRLRLGTTPGVEVVLTH